MDTTAGGAARRGGEDSAMKIPEYLELLHTTEQTLAASFVRMADGYPTDPEIRSVCRTFAGQCDEHQATLQPMLRRYGVADGGNGPEWRHVAGVTETGSGPLGLLRDLEDLSMLAAFLHLTWTVVGQTANDLRDHGLAAAAQACDRQLEIQSEWITTRIKRVAPRALIAGR